MSLIEQQLLTEKEILDLGVSKLKEISGEVLIGKEGWLHSYVKELVWPLALIIQQEHEAAKDRLGRKSHLFNAVKDGFDPFAVAVCTLNATIKNAVQGRVQLSLLAGEIGGNIQDFFGKKLTKYNRIKIGTSLLYFLYKSAEGLFELEADKSAGFIVYTVQFLECQKFKVIKKCISLILGKYSPMLVKPRDWVAAKEGGYLSPELSNKISLVRKRGSDVYTETYSYENIPDVYDAVNFIQSTPFKINTYILDVFNKAVKKGLKIENLPACKPLSLYSYPLPKKLLKADMNEEQRNTLRKWMSVNSHIRKEKQRYQSKMFTINITKELCTRMAQYDEFYFPHNLDYRGRVYPIPVIFNLHSLDYIRGMLLFAEAKELGENGARWLAIHGANCYGIDKESYDDRIKWVKDNELAILFAYRNPIDSTFWQKAKDPFQFLAFCKEWSGYCKFGNNYRCSLPIGVDATCSGLQHYSAMLKDPVGAKYVNVLPSDKPQDIYQEVADVLIRMLENIKSTSNVEEDVRMAEDWLKLGINRKTTKRVVMTTVYSLTKYASRQYIEEYILDKDKNAFTDTFKASLWLANPLWDAVTEVIKGARFAMDYIKLCTKDLAKGQEGLLWQVPSGFTVHQKCVKKESKIIECPFGDKILNLTIVDDSDKVDANRQVNAACPNVIHSLDSCHLMMVANRLKEAGATSFTAIHDCFFTHACDLDKLQQVIREAFVDMYHDNVFLEDFKNFLEYNYKVTLPKVPENSSFNLDVTEVLKSPYFFC
jgi:DNA-directed RNA polymerase